MTKTLKLAALAAFSIGLAGCDRQASTSKADAPKSSATDAKTGGGTGTVTAVDAAAGTITLDHAAIPGVGWPAMKMGFSARPALLNGIAAGDGVAFTITVRGNVGEVTAISKQ